jgi:hypothetical protein
MAGLPGATWKPSQWTGRSAGVRLSALPHRFHSLFGPPHRRLRCADPRAAWRTYTIYIDAGRMLHHVPRGQFPGQALAVELYRHAGIRSVEIGSVMFGSEARHELLRLAIPCRVYTQSHIDYVVAAILEVNTRSRKFAG